MMVDSQAMEVMLIGLMTGPWNDPPADDQRSTDTYREADADEVVRRTRMPSALGPRRDREDARTSR
jgi:hypothetical protein